MCVEAGLRVEQTIKDKEWGNCMETNINMCIILSVISVIALLVAVFGGCSHKKQEKGHKPHKLA